MTGATQPAVWREVMFTVDRETVEAWSDALLEAGALSVQADDADADSPLSPGLGLKLGRTLQRGLASWYGPGLHGRRTANGERYDMHELTAAHKTLPFGTRVLVHNPRTGKQVVVRINDRGPFVGGRVIDLSRAAAEALGILGRGHDAVELHEVVASGGDAVLAGSLN